MAGTVGVAKVVVVVGVSGSGWRGEGGGGGGSVTFAHLDSKPTRPPRRLGDYRYPARGAYVRSS